MAELKVVHRSEKRVVPLGTPLPTDAPSAIGALVASLGAVELGKLMAGTWDESLASRELYMDARHHQHYVTKLSRNPGCRFDHTRWQVSPIPDVAIHEVLTLAGSAGGRGELRVEGDVVVKSLRCPDCSLLRWLWKLRSRLSPDELRCSACSCELTPTGFDLFDGVSAARLPASLLAEPLSRLGLRTGDVFEVLAGGERRRFELAPRSVAPGAVGATVVLAGCGNIGSHLVPHLGRLGGVSRVVLIDPDRYAMRNVAGQDIRRADVGRAKVVVQAERLRAIQPALDVRALALPLEVVPLGEYRDAYLLGGLDSRRARQQLNERAFRVGSPWIDMAVDGPGLLCRISVYRPAADEACLECGWSHQDYSLVEQRLPCDAGGVK